MTEIKPRWEDGDPVCDRDCPSFGRMSTGTAYVHNEHCRITGLQFNEIDDEMHQGYKFVQSGHICIPALRQQRDEYKTRAEAAEATIEDLRLKFERIYAKKSNVTVEFLREHGEHVELCDCEEDGCSGWQMVGKRMIPEAFRILSENEIKCHKGPSEEELEEALNVGHAEMRAFAVANGLDTKPLSVAELNILERATNTPKAAEALVKELEQEIKEYDIQLQDTQSDYGLVEFERDGYKIIVEAAEIRTRQLEIERDEALARDKQLDGIFTHLYNSGYMAGHNDTVEGIFAHISSQDMDSVHQEEVQELVSELTKSEGDTQ